MSTFNNCTGAGAQPVCSGKGNPKGATMPSSHQSTPMNMVLRLRRALCDSFGSSPLRAIKRPGISRARPLLRTFSTGETSWSPGEGVSDSPVSAEMLGSGLSSEGARFAGVKLGGVEVSPFSRSPFTGGERLVRGFVAPATHVPLSQATLRQPARKTPLVDAPLYRKLRLKSARVLSHWKNALCSTVWQR
jgi:hypothetical protein